MRSISDERPPLTGPELELLDDVALGESTRRHSVFARVTPADKLRLVVALQLAGHVVAVTGDGINDTPALRRADVGVAMGGSGTEAAREAAEVVLTDDDFGTIVAAIAEGRRISDNIRSFVAFLLSANLGEVILFAIAVLAGLGAPMTVVQVADGEPAHGRPPGGRAVPRPGPCRDDRPPAPRPRPALPAPVPARARADRDRCRPGRHGRLPDRARARARGGADDGLRNARTGRARPRLLDSCRHGAGVESRRRNPVLFASVALSAVLVVVTIVVAPLRDAFGTEPLSRGAALIVACLAFAPAALTEAAKLVLARRRVEGSRR